MRTECCKATFLTHETNLVYGNEIESDTALGLQNMWIPPGSRQGL